MPNRKIEQVFDWHMPYCTKLGAVNRRSANLVLTQNGVSNIWEQRLTGGPPKQVTHFDSGEIFDFEWSRDGRQLALTRGSESSDVILISNFR